MARTSDVFARCSLDGAPSGAVQELPAWMLDSGACNPMRAAAEPMAALPALAALAALLSEAMVGAAATFSGKAGVTSRDHHPGDRDAAPSFPPKRQLDLFAGSPPPTPAWSALPDQTRQALTGLMTRLLLAHAGGAGSEPRSDGDER